MTLSGVHPYGLVEYKWWEAASNMVAQPMQVQFA